MPAPTNALPALPPKFDQTCSVTNTARSIFDHGFVRVTYEGPSQRGREFPDERVSIGMLGHSHGYITLRPSFFSGRPGVPPDTRSDCEITLPVDLLRPFIAALELGAAELIKHEREYEKAAIERGELTATASGWRKL